MLSFRLGGTDGVSIEAAKWCAALGGLGFEVRTVAGEGTADVIIPGLARARPALGGPTHDAIAAAVEGADVVVVENLLSLPLNPPAAEAVASVLRGRPAVLRHHDLAWQRSSLAATWSNVPTDPRWTHVVLNRASRRELSDRGTRAVILHNRFPLEEWSSSDQPPLLAGERSLVLHPVRAIARKDVPAAVRLAEDLGATYWLTGSAEDGYDGELDRILSAARCEVRRHRAPSIADAYAQSHAVAFPSTWEGFGNPVIESALARRPLAVRPYPVLVEDLAPFGFRWFGHDDADGLRRFLADPDEALLDHNEAVARASFGTDRLPGELASVLERVL